MTGGKRLSVAELRALAIKEMDNYIDMGCFRDPEIARPYLINGFELGYKMAFKRDDEHEYCTWTRDGGWLRSPHGRMVAKAYGQEPIAPKFCEDCGKPVKGE